MMWGAEGDPKSLEWFIERYLPLIDTEMRAVVDEHEPAMGGLSNLVGYHLGWVDADSRRCDARSGKRIRPSLCLLACEACGGDVGNALPAAAGVELLHNFTLVHDDIQDGDRTRRGRPTLWSIWGQAQGINAGDTLFALSQLAMLRLEGRGVSPEIVIEAIRLLNRTCLTLTHGQYLDIGFEGQNAVSVADYLLMIEAKTAALIGSACELGALIGGGRQEIRRHLRGYGRHLGMAFQMQDDVLGIWGDPDVTGKPVGADILRKKKTLPLVHGVEQSQELRSLLSRKRLSEGELRKATSLLEESGSRDYAERRARKHYGQALEALDQAALKGPTAHALQELARRLVRRER